MKKTILCLMGPTASGKTPLAVALVQHLPLEIISVDSAMVYKGMNIGTAKPEADILQIAPHHLIDRVDPNISYSAGQFRKEALLVIEEIHAQNKIPLLVGGTMLYFNVLKNGLAHLPKAHPALREALQNMANKEGWPALHAKLAIVDAKSSKRIHPHDGQRIQRALEVFILTGRPISDWQTQETSPLANYEVHQLALMPSQREKLHDRISARFQQMLAQGFITEVEQLYAREDLTSDLPAIRAVGYSQAWSYLSGVINYETMCETAITATRQLAKRQMTWLRSWPDLKVFDSEERHLTRTVSDYIAQLLSLNNTID